MSKKSWGMVLVLVMLGSAMASAQTKAAPKKRPVVEIGRAGEATPEISSMRPNSIENGKETDIVVKGEFPEGAKLEATRECRLVRAKQLSKNEAHFTVISTTEKGGYCNLAIKGKRSVDDTIEVKPTAAYQAILDKEHEQSKKEYEAREAKREAERKTQVDFAMKGAQEMIGKTWAVKLPNGQSETWTLSSKNPGGGKFKSSSGKDVLVMLQQNGDVMVVPEGGGCMMQGKLKDGKVSGEQSMAATYCKLGQGKWSASISQ